MGTVWLRFGDKSMFSMRDLNHVKYFPCSIIFHFSIFKEYAPFQPEKI